MGDVFETFLILLGTHFQDFPHFQDISNFQDFFVTNTCIFFLQKTAVIALAVQSMHSINRFGSGE